MSHGDIQIKKSTMLPIPVVDMEVIYTQVFLQRVITQAEPKVIIDRPELVPPGLKLGDWLQVKP